MGPTAGAGSPARKGTRSKRGEFPLPRWAPPRALGALRGEAAFSFYPREVWSPAEPRSPSSAAQGFGEARRRARARGGVGGKASGGKRLRSRGRAPHAEGEGGGIRSSGERVPWSVGERRTRWARGARKAGGLPSKKLSSIEPTTIICLPGQDYLSTSAPLRGLGVEHCGTKQPIKLTIRARVAPNFLD